MKLLTWFFYTLSKSLLVSEIKKWQRVLPPSIETSMAWPTWFVNLRQICQEWILSNNASILWIFFLVPKTILLEEFLYIPNYQNITLNLILSSWINSWEKKTCLLLCDTVHCTKTFVYWFQTASANVLLPNARKNCFMNCNIWFDFLCKPDCPRFYEIFFYHTYLTCS